MPRRTSCNVTDAEGGDRVPVNARLAAYDDASSWSGGRPSSGVAEPQTVWVACRAGVEPDNVHVDRASRARASRPELDKALASANRAGDQLVTTHLDRLGRSVPHLVTLGAARQQRGAGLRVLERDIDTATSKCRATHGPHKSDYSRRTGRECSRALRGPETHRPADRRPAPHPPHNRIRLPQPRNPRSAYVFVPPLLRPRHRQADRLRSAQPRTSGPRKR